FSLQLAPDKQQSAMRPTNSFTKPGATDITTVHLTTDHSYSDQRIALEKAILEALQYLQRK
ncbi:MAG TPA: hypothetical protein VHU44_12150, partial [Acidobacteriaceae bacterium]|nr:hypothetical protein [Acidobacteriaceae bacterium]